MARNITRKIQLIDNAGNLCPYQHSVSHMVLKVVGRSGMVYCLDMTGAQYGWMGALVEWDWFERTHTDPWMVPQSKSLSMCAKKRREGVYDKYPSLLDGNSTYRETAKFHIDVTELFDKAMRPFTDEVAAVHILNSSEEEYVLKQQELLDKVRYESRKAFSELDPHFPASAAELRRTLKEGRQ